jgi:hypothetical protein
MNITKKEMPFILLLLVVVGLVVFMIVSNENDKKKKSKFGAVTPITGCPIGPMLPVNNTDPALTKQLNVIGNALTNFNKLKCEITNYVDRIHTYGRQLGTAGQAAASAITNSNSQARQNWTALTKETNQSKTDFMDALGLSPTNGTPSNMSGILKTLDTYQANLETAYSTISSKVGTITQNAGNISRSAPIVASSANNIVSASTSSSLEGIVPQKSSMPGGSTFQPFALVK